MHITMLETAGALCSVLRGLTRQRLGCHCREGGTRARFVARPPGHLFFPFDDFRRADLLACTPPPHLLVPSTPAQDTDQDGQVDLLNREKTRSVLPGRTSTRSRTQFAW